MAEVIEKVKDFIEKYCKILHLANMPAETRARFDKYAKYKDFNGDMKRWPDLLELADKVKAGDLDALPTMPEDKWRDLYEKFQSIFENMSQKKDDFKYKDETTLKFFNTWFGDEPDKLFKPQQPVVPGLEERIEHFAEFLEKYKFALSSIISDKSVYGLDSDFKYDSFVSDIKAGKYKDDPKLRDQLFAVVKYTQNYSDGSNPYYPWKGAPQYDFSVQMDGKVALPLDTDEWFSAKYNPAFKHRAKEIFTKLLTSATVREDFAKYDYSDKVAKHINKAIEETNYDNAESADYVAPKYEDKKNVFERVGDKIDEFKENQLDPWINILRGTRRFFSPYARAIVEGCSKAKNKDGKKLKPTDGLKGILEYKDAIIEKISEKSPKGKAHFEWFAKKLDVYSKKTPKSFEGAFYNPYKLKAIVSQIIVDGIQDGKIAEAKSALEVLSTMKYGFTHSRIVDGIHNEFKKKDSGVLSQLEISKKYKAIGFFANVADKSLQAAIVGGGRLIAMGRNAVFRHNTKFNGNMKFVDDAHKQWQTRNNSNDIDNALKGVTDSLDQQKKSKTVLDTWMRRYGGKSRMEQQLNDYNSLKQQKQKAEEYLQQKSYEMQGFDGTQGADIKREVQQLTNDLQVIDAKLANTMDLTEIRNLNQEKQQKSAELAQKQAALGPINDIEQKEAELDNIEQQLAGYDEKTIGRYQKMLDRSSEIDGNIDGLTDQQTALNAAKQKFSDDFTDKYHDLMIYWDMLETFSMSHQFTFAADKMRDKFVKDFGQKDENDNPLSEAEKKAKQFLELAKKKHYSNVA